MTVGITACYIAAFLKMEIFINQKLKFFVKWKYSEKEESSLRKGIFSELFHAPDEF